MKAWKPRLNSKGLKITNTTVAQNAWEDGSKACCCNMVSPYVRTVPYGTRRSMCEVKKKNTSRINTFFVYTCLQRKYFWNQITLCLRGINLINTINFWQWSNLEEIYPHKKNTKITIPEFWFFTFICHYQQQSSVLCSFLVIFRYFFNVVYNQDGAIDWSKKVANKVTQFGRGGGGGRCRADYSVPGSYSRACLITR